MPLTIKLGDLYSSRRHKRTREIVKAHVWAHFVSHEQLARDGVEVAIVRCVFTRLFKAPRRYSQSLAGLRAGTANEAQ
jgi:hypothetical protein